MSPDTVSSHFPDRPIRPMPKRRLRERLSPEVADSIKFPPSAHDSVPLFQYPPYSTKYEGTQPGLGSMSQIEHGRRTDPSNHQGRRHGVGAKAVEDGEVITRSTLVTRSPPEILSRLNGSSAKPEQPRQTNPQPPPSAASSVDGYDSFENTNNKKKRKIPSAGDISLNGSHGLGNDATAHGTTADSSSPISELSGDKLGHNSTPSLGLSSTGISGPGRGRLGRVRNGRSPLRALPDGNNTLAGRLLPKHPSSQRGSSDYAGSGIISSAIANAGKLPPQGQENISLLQQQSLIAKTTPTSTQFNFTFGSQVPGSPQWPGDMSKHAAGSQMAPAQASINNSSNHDGSSKAASRGSGSSRKKSHRRLEKELLDAARHRQRITEDINYHNPPKPEDVWVCEFCEYERIFGEKPLQLIKSYEKKDRRVRQEEADRKRLLEKAKAKSRKGKKNTKAPPKGTPATNHADDVPPDDQSVPPQMGNGHSTQSEEDEVEGDYPAEHEDDCHARHLSQGSHVDGGGGRLYHHHHRPQAVPP